MKSIFLGFRLLVHATRLTGARRDERMTESKTPRSGERPKIRNAQTINMEDIELKTTLRIATLGAALIIILLPANIRAVELVTNGSFETGMTGWTINNATNPWFVWQSVTAGFSTGFLSPAAPQAGSRAALQGVTGDAGTRFITQDFTIPSGSTAQLQWRHRFQYDLATFCSGSGCGTGLYTVDLLNTSNVLLANLYTRNATAGQIVDTGWQSFSQNISAFAGQTVRLRFRTTVTANLAGPGQLEIDAVSVNAFVPTAAESTIAGRIVDSFGNPISRAYISITDSNGTTRTIASNSFGFYNLEGLNAGETYTVAVSHKRYLFADSPRVINLQDNVNELNFVAAPSMERLTYFR